MVAGHRAFSRPTAAETMTAILNEDPPEIKDSAKQIPPELSAVLAHCLEKNPQERFHSAHDLAFALRAILRGSAISKAVPVSRRRSTIDSLAVLPFLNASADPNAEYLSDGITESLINGLSQLPKIRVTARSTAFRYKGRDVDPQAVGRELNVRALLMGRVVQRGDALSIQVDLVDVADGSQLWGDRYNRRLSDIFEIEEEIARQISEKLRMKLTGDQKKRLAKRQTQNTEAYQLYLKGRYHWNKRTEEGIQKGIEYFQQAIEKDPTYALAYVGLADAYGVRGVYSEQPAREATEKMRAMAAKARAYARSGNRGEAETLLGHLLDLARGRYVPSYHIAMIYVDLGDKDQACQWLEQAHEERAPFLMYAKVDPCLDSLRPDPRFRDLLRRMGIET
jgi:TolB-like protein